TSRSGHVLEFCDDKDNKAEKITLKSKAGAKVVIDDSDGAKKIEIYDDKGKNYILIDATNNKITIQATDADMLIKAKNTIQLQAKTMKLESDKDTEFKAGANFKVAASDNVDVNSSGGSASLKASSTITIKGSTVNIN